MIHLFFSVVSALTGLMIEAQLMYDIGLF